MLCQARRQSYAIEHYRVTNVLRLVCMRWNDIATRFESFREACTRGHLRVVKLHLQLPLPKTAVPKGKSGESSEECKERRQQAGGRRIVRVMRQTQNQISRSVIKLNEIKEGFTASIKRHRFDIYQLILDDGRIKPTTEHITLLACRYGTTTLLTSTPLLLETAISKNTYLAEAITHGHLDTVKLFPLTNFKDESNESFLLTQCTIYASSPKADPTVLTQLVCHIMPHIESVQKELVITLSRHAVSLETIKVVLKEWPHVVAQDKAQLYESAAPEVAYYVWCNFKEELQVVNLTKFCTAAWFDILEEMLTTTLPMFPDEEKKILLERLINLSEPTSYNLVKMLNDDIIARGIRIDTEKLPKWLFKAVSDSAIVKLLLLHDNVTFPFSLITSALCFPETFDIFIHDPRFLWEDKNLLLNTIYNTNINYQCFKIFIENFLPSVGEKELLLTNALQCTRQILLEDHVKMVELLLKDPNINPNNCLPKHLNSAYYNLDLLLQPFEADERTDVNELLSCVAKIGITKIVKSILEKTKQNNLLMFQFTVPNTTILTDIQTKENHTKSSFIFTELLNINPETDTNTQKNKDNNNHSNQNSFIFTELLNISPETDTNTQKNKNNNNHSNQNSFIFTEHLNINTQKDIDTNKSNSEANKFIDTDTSNNDKNTDRFKRVIKKCKNEVGTDKCKNDDNTDMFKPEFNLINNTNEVVNTNVTINNSKKITLQLSSISNALKQACLNSHTEVVKCILEDGRVNTVHLDTKKLVADIALLLQVHKVQIKPPKELKRSTQQQQQLPQIPVKLEPQLFTFTSEPIPTSSTTTSSVTNDVFYF